MINIYIYPLFILGLLLSNLTRAFGSEASIVNLDFKSDVSCHGMSDGSASFILVGIGPFNYDLVGLEAGSTTAIIGAITLTNLSAGSYTLIVEDERLLLSSTFDTLKFTIDEPDPLSIIPNITHINCNNPTGLVELNISGGSGSYSSLLDGLLINLGLNEILNVSLGAHLVRVSDSNGCEIEEEVIIQQIPDPVLSLGADLNLGCLDLLDLNAMVTGGGGSKNYLWTTNDGNIVNTVANIASISQAGTYTATVTDANGCSSQDQIVVSADIDLPIINLASEINLGCLDSRIVTADVAVGVQVSWQTANGQILGSSSGKTIVVGAPGIYFATALNPATGCESTKILTVTADVALPSLDLGADVNLGCLSQLTLSANVGAGVEVSWVTSNGSILGSHTGPAITLNAPGTYIAVATNLLGCQTTDEITVHANVNLPSINLGADLNLGCLADINLSANVGSGVLVDWFTTDGHILGNATGKIITVNKPGTYTAIATNSIGCQDTDQIVVNVDIDIPVIDLGADLAISCEGELSLVANLLSKLNIDVLWHALDGGHIIGSNHGYEIDIDKPGTYIAVATNLVTNCFASDTVRVTGDVSLLDIDLGADLTLACGASLNISATLPVGINLMPTWSTQDGHIVGSSTGLEITVDLPGIYVATIVDPILGCSISSSIQIFGDSPIDLNLGPDTIMGCNDTIILQTQSPGSLLNLEIQWTTQNGSIIGNLIGHEIAINQPGTYIAIAVNLLTGCTGKDTIVVIGKDINVDLGPDQNLDCQGMLTISSQIEGFSNPIYSWQTLEGNIVGPTNGSSIVVDKTGIYSITVTDQQTGCFAIDNITVSERPSLEIIGNDQVNLNCGESYVTSVQISGTTGLIVDWYLNGELFAQNTQEISITAPGIYVALANDFQSNCRLFDTLRVSGFSVHIEATSPVVCGVSIMLEAQISGATGLLSTWATLAGEVLATDTNQLTITETGTYIAFVIDQEGGCTVSDTITINKFGLIVNLGDDRILGCGEVFEASVQIKGGSNYLIIWQTLGGQVLASNTDHLLIEAAGTYLVTVEDQENGCTGSDTIEVKSSGLEIDLGPQGYLIACGGTTQITANVEDVNQVFFSWSTLDGEIIGSSQGPVIVVAQAGTYTVFAENISTGCSTNASVEVFQEGIGPAISVSEDQVINCEGFNELEVTADDLNSVSVSWTTLDGLIDQMNGTSILVSKPGTYVVAVEDNLTGCSSMAKVLVLDNLDCDTIKYPCCDDTTLVTCEPYFYGFPSVDTSVPYVVTQVSGLCSGSVFPIGENEIVFFISYETGDFDVISWTVTVLPFDLKAEISEPSCFGGNDGSIRLILPAEDGPFRLRWNTTEVQFGSVAENLTQGTYTVTGLTGQACIVNQTFHLCQPDPLTLVSGLTISETDQLSDGAINVTAGGGTAPYSFEWYLDNQLVSTEEDLYFFPAGSYTLKLTDARGCIRIWEDLIISRISSDQAYSLYQQVRYPDKLVRYIKVFPNPSTEEVNLKLELKENATISVDMVDQLGHIIEDRPAVYSDKQELMFKLENYLSGIYHMIIKIDDGIYVKKILILD